MQMRFLLIFLKPGRSCWAKHAQRSVWLSQAQMAAVTTRQHTPLSRTRRDHSLAAEELSDQPAAVLLPFLLQESTLGLAVDEIPDQG